MHASRRQPIAAPTATVSSPDAVLSDLTPAWQRLARLLQRLHYGRVKDLLVRAGEPVFEPPPRVTRTYRLTPGGSNQPRPQIAARGMSVRSEWIELMHRFEELGDGIVLRMDVLDGVPTVVELEGAYDGQEGLR